MNIISPHLIGIESIKITKDKQKNFQYLLVNLEIQFLIANTFFPVHPSVLHREAGHGVRHDLAAVLRSLRGRQLGPGQGLPLHHPHLQRVHFAGPLRTLPLLLRHQGPSQTL